MESSVPIGRGPRFADVARLLESSGLPTSDLTADDMADFFYAGESVSPAEVIGMQFYGSDALLRSLVVAESQRTQGIGQRLVEPAELFARERGAKTIHLLTTTVEAFFRSRGYVVTPREHAPVSIRTTPEFAGLCPASSAFLSKRL